LTGIAAISGSVGYTNRFVTIAHLYTYILPSDAEMYGYYFSQMGVKLS